MYGRTYFWEQAAPFLALLVLSAANGFITEANGSGIDAHAWTLFAAGVVSLYLLVLEELPEFWNIGLIDYLRNIFNYFSCGSYVLIIGLCVARLSDENSYMDMRPIVFTVATLCLFARLMEFLSIIKVTAPFVQLLVIFSKVVVKWLVVFILFEFAFTLQFYVLLHNCNTAGRFDDPFSAMMNVFAFSMGELSLPLVATGSDDDDDDDRKHSCHGAVEYVAGILLLVLVFVLTVCYLNLLIAMMSQSYTDAQRVSQQLAYQNIAQALLRWESTMSRQQQKSFYNLLHPHQAANDEVLKLPRGIFGHKSHAGILTPDDVRIHHRKSVDRKFDTMSMMLHNHGWSNLPSLSGLAASEQTRLMAISKQLKVLEEKVDALTGAPLAARK